MKIYSFIARYTETNNTIINSIVLLGLSLIIIGVLGVLYTLFTGVVSYSFNLSEA